MTVPAPKLGAEAIKAAIDKSKVPVAKITDVYMGNVLQAGAGQAPARQASIFAGLPPTVEAVTVNKVCASGLKAVVQAAQNIQLGLAEAQVAGGMENMSRVPYYLPRAAQNPPFGTMKLEDGLISDGLWDVYNQFHMGNCAENTAKKFKISREAQDEYAIRSFERAQAAWAEGKFEDEIVPVTVKGKKGDVVISKDEGFENLKKDKVATLKPAFVRDGRARSRLPILPRSMMVLVPLFLVTKQLRGSMARTAVCWPGSSVMRTQQWIRSTSRLLQRRLFPLPSSALASRRKMWPSGSSTRPLLR